MRVYEKRPDVGSVVHAHPIYANIFCNCRYSADTADHA